MACKSRAYYIQFQLIHLGTPQACTFYLLFILYASHTVPRKREGKKMINFKKWFNFRCKVNSFAIKSERKNTLLQLLYRSVGFAFSMFRFWFLTIDSYAHTGMKKQYPRKRRSGWRKFNKNYMGLILSNGIVIILRCPSLLMVSNENKKKYK